MLSTLGTVRGDYSALKKSPYLVQLPTPNFNVSQQALKVSNQNNLSNEPITPGATVLSPAS